MKIITWNCNMAFRKKAALLMAEQPDILVIPECESEERMRFADNTSVPSGMVWHGNNPHKGLGVFAFNGYQLTLLDCHNPEFKHILPIAVTGGAVDFLLFAIWANNPEDKDGPYVTQLWKALHYYDDLLRNSKSTMFIGDFNSNSVWDKPRREGNHTALVALLEEQNIYSTYHLYYQQLQGKEAHPTFYLYRHQDKPYHLDYCFASTDFIQKMKTVTVGTYEDWYKYSDHQPLAIDFEL